MTDTKGNDGSETSVSLQPNPVTAGTVHVPYSDNSSLQITSHKLNGKNYLPWSRSVEMVIRGKGRYGYLDGSTKKPVESDSFFLTWDAQNSMVMAWLINSMDEKISESFMCYTTAKLMWEAAKRQYSDLENSSQLFELRNKARNLTQAEMDVTTYFNALTKLWQEVDLFNNGHWLCSGCIEKHQTMVNKDRIYDFLAGLNKDLDEVRGRLLGSKSLPNIEDIFAEVRREETRKRVMLGTVKTTAENSAFSARGSENFRSQKRNGKFWCDYCQRSDHSRDRCWKLHGKPDNWKDTRNYRRDSKGLQVTTDTALRNGDNNFNFSIIKEQMEQLHQLLNTQSSNQSQPIAQSLQSQSSTSFLAKKGTFITALSGISEMTEPWVIDSGATDHMTGCASIFSSYKPSPGNLKIKIADGSLATVAGTGIINISPQISLIDALHVPKLSCNLLSVSKITKDLNCTAQFSHSICKFQDMTSGMTIGSAKEHNGLYYFEEGISNNKQALTVGCEFLSLSREQQIMLWHSRLGHPNFQYLKQLFPTLFRNKDVFQCDVCQIAKHQRSNFPSQPYKSSKPFALIHSDLWGPSRVPNVSGKKWFITFIDDHTRITWVYLLKEKGEAEQTFKHFHLMVNNQFNAKIQILRTDNGREYFNSILGGYFLENGIIHQNSCVDTPQQNGVAERKNRHLLEVARSIMFTNNVPKYFWGDSILTACYLINRLPTRVLNFKIPFKFFLQYYPQTRSIGSLPLKVFGCKSFVHVHNHNRSKLDPRALPCIFLGYSATQKGYRCYSPEKRKYFVTMDVTFFENQPFYKKNSLQGEFANEAYLGEPTPSPYLGEPTPSPILPLLDNSPTLANPTPAEETQEPTPVTNDLDLSINSDNSRKGGDSQQQPDLRVYSRKNVSRRIENIVDLSPCHESEPNSSTEVSELDYPIALRKGVRSCTQHPISNYVFYNHFSPSLKAFISNMSEEKIPRDIQEAMRIPKWRQAVTEEIQALEKNQTWHLVKKPEGKTSVGCKWVFTVKYQSDGTIERYKARLVAKGFTQTYGIDYNETFAPVAKLNTVRVLLSLAANLDWDLQQLDVKNAFLNGDLEEEVYMDLPPGFDKDKKNGTVCRLKKALYGLKQSPRAWFGRFTKAVLQQGYMQAHTDHTLFYRHKDGKSTILIVYVDDIILTGNDTMEMKRLKTRLASEFEIKDLGSLRYFLGMEVARNKKGISVTQRKYVLDLLKETGMLGSKPVDTPMDSTTKLGDKKDGTPVDTGRYQRLVGKLIYLSHTRPDIAFAVSVVSQYMHAPCEEHMEAVLRILKYLKGSPGKGLFFSKNETRSIEGFTDADWAGSIEDRRSTSGYCTFVWGNLVTWRSKKQTVVARSSAEAEFRAMAHGTCEMLWLKLLLEELEMKINLPLKIYCDNKAAISISHNPVHHDRTKHVEVDRHFIKEKIENGILCIIYVSTGDQVADALTKALARKMFGRQIDKLGMFNLGNPT